MRLDIESLRALKAVAEAGGVTRAAGRLHLTQSAVSHKIKRLEDRIGRRLFRRGDGGLAPTEDGVQLLRYAERLLSLHDEAAALFGGRDLAGKLRLGITEDITGTRLTGILARFSRVYPKVALSARVEQSLTLRAWLDRGDLDLAVIQVFADELLPGDRILWRDDLVWVQAPDFEPPNFEPSGGRLPFVSFDRRCFYRRRALEALKERRQTLDVVLECPSFEGVRSAVRSGLGLAILNRRNMRPGLIESGLELPPLPPIAYVVRSAQPAPGPAAAALMDAIEDELREPNAAAQP